MFSEQVKLDWHQRKLLLEQFEKTDFESSVFSEAQEYLELCHYEQKLPEACLAKRLAEVRSQLEQKGTYWQTLEELAYGAKVAWRNSTRCIGRIFWQSLVVRDMRHLTTAKQVFEAVAEHIRAATNGGSIRPTITVFAADQLGQPGIRIWNSLLIRYAGYLQSDGLVIGDPAQVEFTNFAQRLGWKGAGTKFDVLPIIIQMPGEKPQVFELPPEVILEVPLIHPDYPWFAELGLKWHALPAVSDMRLEIGGISYSAAPFNGWYMSAEIGSRNLGDVKRYNLLPIIAERMGLNTKSKLSLWKDRALIELNAAVLYSFARHGVSMVDHHSASHQFIRHTEKEEELGRIVPADWGWIVPPISGSATEVFHREYQNIILKPNFFKQSESWRQTSLSRGCPFH